MSKVALKVLLCLFLCAIPGIGGAEMFRVHQTAVIELTPQSRPQKVMLGYNDVVCVNLPSDKLFLQGFELEIKIPQTMLNFRNSIAYSFYKNIKPVPTSKQIDYTADRLHIDTIPGRLSMVLQIPLVETHTLKNSPYVVLIPYYGLEKEPRVLFRLQPVMKGLPENIEDLRFEVDIKPILLNEGLFDLRVAYPEGEEKPFSLFIDEKPLAFDALPVRLEPGIHHVSLVSEYYRNEVRTFTIEQARATVLEVTLRDMISTVLLTGPEGARVFLDETEVASGGPIPVTPGEHAVRFSIGGYEVTKSFTIVNGREYTVSLSIDLQISETP